MPLRRSSYYGLFLALLTLGFCFGAYAQTDPNVFFSFKKIYLKPVADNVDGALGPMFEGSFKEVFSKNPRFVVVSKREDADSEILTKVEKKPSSVDFEIRLKVIDSQNPNVQSDTENLFTTERSSVSSEASVEEIAQAAKKSLKAILKKIPFYGSVTGREENIITLDIGTSNGLKEGDVVQIARVDWVKKHPLLKNILDVSMIPAGTIELDSVESTISFGKIKEEFAGEKIQRLYKVAAVESHASDKPMKSVDAVKGRLVETEEGRPEIGYLGVGVMLDSLSYSASQNNGAAVISGRAFDPGVRIAGELWLTKNWFIDTNYAFSGSSIIFTEDVSKKISSSQDTSTSAFNLDLGYRHYLWSSVRGPNVYFKFGYGTFSWTAPVESTWLLGKKTFSGLHIGIGGSVPLNRKKQDGITLGVGLGLFSSYKESGVLLTPDTTQSPSPTVVNFNVGYYNYFLQNMALRIDFILNSYSVEYSGGTVNYGSSTASIKQVGIVPSFSYYF